MASKICSSCLRTTQRISGRAFMRQAPSASRAFTIGARRNAEHLPPNATVATSIPAVTPTIGGSNSKASSEISKENVSALKAGRLTETYSAYGATEVLYKECASHAKYKIPKPADEDAEVPKTEGGEDIGVGEGSWHKELNLPATFSTWSQVTMLHMYLLSARFRCFEAASASTWNQHLLDHFFYDAENRMSIDHGMHARGTRNKYLKDLFIQWRGLLAAYDEGLMKGDTVLAAAVWRNVYKANEDVDIRQLAQIVAYMRNTMQKLDSVSSNALQQAKFGFGSLTAESATVATKSKMIDLTFEKAAGKPMDAVLAK